MNSKEVAKFFSGFAANQVLNHAAFAMSGAQFTIFGIAYGRGLNATAAIVWATALALLIYHAWINRWRSSARFCPPSPALFQHPSLPSA